MTSKQSTKNRILDAAEALFADRGFAETSLRTITHRADVNLASVNYHFGSKKSLIQAVFDRFLQGFVKGLDAEMQPLERSAAAPSVEQVLHTLVKPLMTVDDRRQHGSSNFMKLLGRAYAESQGHMRRFMQEHYAAYLVRFTSLLHRAAPDLTNNEMFWRLHFMLGTVIFTLAGSDALRDIAASDFRESVSLEQTLERLLPFLAAGFRAEPIHSLKNVS
ncbi:TetR/AcrR family transcriptional regulator [Pleionea litopenaei]|uniref:TetR/AcrR family transcriptional regulator n=1 Tax=Pleionea litopenaei TaxID=3070815 RepID=A0AA51X7P8_9GAMM|nr:TetR/AcrR family transcriptional regulator [Pleionea sp. HL-JVS1]WMS88448.1 TetR/AcrR family transcriptional regulator [Pleionea sp. HL-JVS1]